MAFGWECPTSNLTRRARSSHNVQAGGCRQGPRARIRAAPWYGCRVLAETHGTIGWLIGLFAPGSDRRLRNWCAAAAVIPDIDALTYLGGQGFYEHWHRTFGHNILLGVICVAAAVRQHRDRPPARRALVGLLVAISFASHLIADACLTQYEVYLWWPLSRQGWNVNNVHEIGDPLHTKLYYGAFVLLALVAAWKKITPVDIVSTRLDRLLINVFRRRDLVCTSCAGACNNRCDTCSAPVCMSHAGIRSGFRLICRACAPGQTTR